MMMCLRLAYWLYKFDVPSVFFCFVTSCSQLHCNSLFKCLSLPWASKHQQKQRRFQMKSILLPTEFNRANWLLRSSEKKKKEKNRIWDKGQYKTRGRINLTIWEWNFPHAWPSKPMNSVFEDKNKTKQRKYKEKAMVTCTCSTAQENVNKRKQASKVQQQFVAFIGDIEATERKKET